LNYDAIITGAGPAGILAATKVAEDGYIVLMLEEHKKIGEPDHCAGLLSSSGLEALNLKPPDEVIQNTVAGARIYAPSGHSIFIERGKREAFVVDRRKFDSWLAENAANKGVQIVTESKVMAITQSKKGVQTVKTGHQSLQSKVVVIA